MKRNKNLVWSHVDATGLDLKGLKAAVIGGTGGLGRAISQLLASRGASVTVVGQTFRDAGVPGLEFLQADLSLMAEARRVAAELPVETLDLVVLTTGILAAPTRQETAEGLERDMAVSYLSRLVLVRGIAPRLGKHRPATAMKPRVFIMGFPGAGQAGALGDLNAEKSYKSMAVHRNTIAGNEMLVVDSAKRYANASFFGLNPGIIKTNIRSNLFGEGTLRLRSLEWMVGLLTPTAEDYARTVTPLLVSPDLEGHSGAMFDKKGEAILPSAGLMDGHVRAFLAESEALVARAGAPTSAPRAEARP